MENNTTTQMIKTAGRTLLVKSNKNVSLNDSLFENLTGLLSNVFIKPSNSYFLTFNNVENSKLAYEKFSENTNCNVKYSYYRLFFTITGLEDNTDYKVVKTDFTKYLSTVIDSNVLYCKFYMKDKKYIGCGNMTIDTMEGMNKLLSKDSEFKNFSFGPYKGTFYRFNANKLDKPQPKV